MARTVSARPRPILTTKQRAPYKTEHARKRRAAIKDGTWQPFTDPTEAKARARTLFDAGYGIPALAGAFGLSGTTVAHLLNARHPQIRVETHQAVMGATLDPRRLPARALIPTLGTRRRLYALARMGWSYSDVARHIGVTHAAVAHVIHRRRLNAGLAAAIARAYDDLWAHPGSKSLISAIAFKKGMPGPLHLDDDMIDDPAIRTRADGMWWA